MRKVLCHELTHAAMEQNDSEMARKVEPMEEVIDALTKELKDRHIQRVQAGNCTLELGFVFNDCVTNLERVADHCSNIAVCLIQTGEHDFEMHNYIHKLAKGENTPFHKCYLEYRDRYGL